MSSCSNYYYVYLSSLKIKQQSYFTLLQTNHFTKKNMKQKTQNIMIYNFHVIIVEFKESKIFKTSKQTNQTFLTTVFTNLEILQNSL